MDALKSELISTNGLRCVHINTNWLRAKIEEIRLLVHVCKVDILAVTESHLSEDTVNTEISIEDYLLLRKDRTGQSNHWGGTVIYYHKDLHIYELDIPENNMEAIWMEAVMMSQKIVIACIYRPPKDKAFISNFRKIAEKFCHRSNVLLLGDFNIDLSADQESQQTRHFKQTLYELNLTNVIKNYTRVTDRSKTLIDLALTIDTSKVSKCGTFPIGLSDHDLIYTVININREKTPPRLIEVRNYKDVDEAKLREDLDLAPWHLINLFEDPNDSLWCWEYMFKDIISSHLKTRKIKVRSNNQPWITGEIRHALNERYNLLKKARKTERNSVAWAAYKRMKNYCTNLIRLTKANYWKLEFQRSDSSKHFWKTVKKFQGQSNKSTIGTLQDANGVPILDDSDKANELNNFFASVGRNLASAHNTSNLNLNSHIYRVVPTINNIDLSFDAFSKAFTAAVKSGKSSGPDEISASDLKLNENASKEGLFRVLTQSVKSGFFPDKWKTAKVCCAHKKGSTKDCSNYRPISLLSISSKVVEKFICNQMQSHIHTFNLQSDNQWGFRAQRSTEDLLLHMTEQWRKAVDKGNVVAVLFLDFKKAFDSISHEVLLKKLSASGISGDFHKFIASYLKDRNQFTVVNNKKSDTEHISYGVPQGSILGPNLFSINVNDMPDSTDCDTELFADDSNCFEIGKTVDTVLTNLQSNLDQVGNYSSRNFLTLHPEKCEVMIISKSKFIGPLPELTIYGKKVNFVDKSKCLGITIDEKLSWNPHIENVCRQFRAKIRRMHQMRHMTKTTLSTIYFQGILPSVLYGIIIWGGCASHLLASIEKLHLRAARFINRVKKSTIDSLVLQQLKWKSISHYYKRSIACKTYKIFFNLSPSVLSSYILKANSRLRTRNKLRLNLPSFRYVHYKQSFSYRSAIIWNNIANDIREKPSLNSFKSALLKSNALEQINFGCNATGRALDYVDFVYF